MTTPSLARNIGKDIVIMQLVDSLRAKEFNLDHLYDNAGASVLYRMLVQNMIVGKLPDIIPNSDVENIAEVYAGRLVSLWASNFAMGKHPELKSLGIRQAIYTLADYLYNNIQASYPQLPQL